MIDKSPQKIQDMFNKIAQKYDLLNNAISFGLHKQIKKSVFGAIKIKDNFKILDICTGTGDGANILKIRNPKAQITGLDFSNSMLEIARKKYGKSIDFILGDVCDMKFEDNTFDVVTASFGLRNIENMEKALFEIYRVLKGKGLFVHLDFSSENIFLNFIFDTLTPFFAKILGGDKEAYKYLINSKREFKKPSELIKEFENEGFTCLRKETYLFNTIAAEFFEKP